MKILITGANGIIGSFLSKKLKSYDVFTPHRSVVDFTDTEQVDKLFNSHSKFDVVIHCASVGGHRLKKDSWSVLDDNLKMYYNILKNKGNFDKFIVFGSGAEMHLEDTPYGLSKKVISKSVSCYDNFYNIRIYGLFGDGELSTRFIRSSLTNYLHKNPIQIHENKFMDFFYIEDLLTIVKYYIHENSLPKVIDCCYKKEKVTLYEIANMINKLDNHRVDINKISDPAVLTQYIGSEDPILTLPLSLIGLDQALRTEYKKLKSEI